MLHQFPLVSKQAKNGLYCLKRTANYLQKVANAHEACANAIIAANQHEKTKVTFDDDAMKSFGEAYLQMQEVTIQVAQKQRALGEGIVEGVVKPLLEHFTQAEAKRLQINKEEERQSYMLSNAHEGEDRHCNPRRVFRFSRNLISCNSASGITLVLSRYVFMFVLCLSDRFTLGLIFSFDQTDHLFFSCAVRLLVLRF